MNQSKLKCGNVSELLKTFWVLVTRMSWEQKSWRVYLHPRTSSAAISPEWLGLRSLDLLWEYLQCELGNNYGTNNFQVMWEWDSLPGRILPENPSLPAEREVPEGSAWERASSVPWSCAKTTGTKIAVETGLCTRSPRTVFAFTQWLWLGETTYWVGKEKRFRRRPLLVIKPDRRKERKGSGSELAKSWQILNWGGNDWELNHSYQIYIACV